MERADLRMKCFSLTKWNLNMSALNTSSGAHFGFSLTKWNLNEQLDIIAEYGGQFFIN